MISCGIFDVIFLSYLLASGCVVESNSSVALNDDPSEIVQRDRVGSSGRVQSIKSSEKSTESNGSSGFYPRSIRQQVGVSSTDSLT